FFFQAEDGIRDRNVTGVQTCALPIWDAHLLGKVVVRAPGQRRADPPRLPVLYVQFPFGCSAAAAGEHPPCRQQAEQPEYHSLSRSEERRVGKEWMSRWELSY